MNLRQAAQQALEALERGETKLRWAAITALRAALAEPEQEPVAWRYRGNLHEFDPSDWAEGPVTPLYTAPAPRKPLTEGEMPTLFVGGLALNSEATTEIVRAVEKAHGIGGQT